MGNQGEEPDYGKRKNIRWETKIGYSVTKIRGKREEIEKVIKQYFLRKYSKEIEEDKVNKKVEQ
ncbi:hypothetical protein V6O07_22840 [Arthrospira platensis SPKY2]